MEKTKTDIDYECQDGSWKVVSNVRFVAGRPELVSGLDLHVRLFTAPAGKGILPDGKLFDLSHMGRRMKPATAIVADIATNPSNSITLADIVTDTRGETLFSEENWGFLGYFVQYFPVAMSDLGSFRCQTRALKRGTIFHVALRLGSSEQRP